MTIEPVRTGVIFGLFLTLVHAGWILLVALGWAQPLMDFVFWAHFITPPYSVAAFDAGRASMLLILVLGAGFALGALAAGLWNLLGARQGRS